VTEGSSKNTYFIEAKNKNLYWIFCSSFDSPMPLPVAALPAVRLTAHTPAKLYEGEIFVSSMTTGRIGYAAFAGAGLRIARARS
jgi:hypothetical protein